MKRTLGFIFAALLAGNAMAFDLTSPDVKMGHPMGEEQEYKGFGCKGGNLSPELNWKGAPAGTLSYAVTVYDPDAPTGSGWWHWVVYDIPASASGLPGGAVVKTALPAGAKQGRNDYGDRNFGGACPPAGDKPHHYIFTVYALKVAKLDVPEDASPALIGFMLHANRIGLAKLTATYSR
jgi:hypothetical protein